MTDLILLIGGNLGDRLALLTKARELISQEVGEVKHQSKTYKTEAWGGSPQPYYLNQALLVHTQHTAHHTLTTCQSIENKLGRKREERWNSRTMDIDLISYGTDILKTETLELPHPRIGDRKFVMIPMLDIVPMWTHPISGLSLEDMMRSTADTLLVEEYATAST